MKTERKLLLLDFVAAARVPPTTKQVQDWFEDQPWADPRCLRSIQRDLRELARRGLLRADVQDGVTRWMPRLDDARASACDRG